MYLIAGVSERYIQNKQLNISTENQKEQVLYSNLLNQLRYWWSLISGLGKLNLQSYRL